MGYITVRFKNYHNRCQVAEFQKVDPTSTVGHLREMIEKELETSENCMMRMFVRWHVHFTLRGSNNRTFEITEADEANTIASMSIEDYMEVLLEGPITDSHRGIGQALAVLHNRWHHESRQQSGLLKALVEGQSLMLNKIQLIADREALILAQKQKSSAKTMINKETQTLKEEDDVALQSQIEVSDKSAQVIQSGNTLSEEDAYCDTILSNDRSKLKNFDLGTASTGQGTLMPPSMFSAEHPTNEASPIANYSDKQPLQTVTPSSPTSNRPLSTLLPVSVNEATPQQSGTITASSVQRAELLEKAESLANYSDTFPQQPFQTTTSSAPTSNRPPSSSPLQKDALADLSAQKAEPPIGFHNMGNTCYLNASMQALLATPFLIEEIEKHFRSNANSSNSSLIENIKNRFCSNVNLWEPSSRSSPANLPGSKGVSKDLIELAQCPMDPSVSLMSLKFKCTERNDVFTGARQSDAHEFLRVLLLLLHENTNRIQGKPIYQEMKDYPNESVKAAADRWWLYHLSRDDSLVYDIFGGQQHSVVECRMCGYQLWSFNPFLDLVLSFSKVKCPPISLMLQDYTGAAHLTDPKGDHRCPYCKKPQDADRQVMIARWPESLSLSLSRFDEYGRKNSAEVEIEEVIITAPDCSADQASRRYELHSIVVHSGTADCGHYYAYVKKGGKWYRCDDSIIREVPFTAVKQEGEGVYVLLYQKVRPLNPPHY